MERKIPSYICMDLITLSNAEQANSLIEKNRYIIEEGQVLVLRNPFDELLPIDKQVIQILKGVECGARAELKSEGYF